MQSKYDTCFQQISHITSDEADTYKCFATNEYGKAICSGTLNVIEGERSIYC